MSRLGILGAALVVAVVAVAWMQGAVSETKAPMATSVIDAATALAGDTPARIKSGRVAAPSKQADATVDHSRDLLLPDGTYTSALNGAIDAAPLHEYWGARQWSPIVGVECNDAGIEWYRHANGSYSTTQMVMRSDLGRMATMTRVAHIGQAPVATAPK